MGLIGQVLYPMGLQAAPHRCFGYLGEARIALQVGQERRDLDDVVAGHRGLGQDLSMSASTCRVCPLMSLGATVLPAASAATLAETNIIRLPAVRTEHL